MTPQEIYMIRDYRMPANNRDWNIAINQCNGNGSSLEDVIPQFLKIQREKNEVKPKYRINLLKKD